MSRVWLDGKITTSDRDSFDCIPMKSGLAGEGFRMKTTSGVRYYFDVAVQRYGGQMTRQVGDLITYRAGRVKVYLLASKIEDRFQELCREWVVHHLPEALVARTVHSLKDVKNISLKHSPMGTVDQPLSPFTKAARSPLA